MNAEEIFQFIVGDFFVLVVAWAICVFVYRVVTHAVAQRQFRKLGRIYFNDKMIVCRERTFVFTHQSRTGGMRLTELSQPRLEGTVGTPSSKAHSLNGVEYTGRMIVTADAIRVWDDNAWQEWWDGGYCYPSMRLDGIPGFPRISIVRRNGRWHIVEIDFPSDLLEAWTDASSKLSCASVPQ